MPKNRRHITLLAFIIQYWNFKNSCSASVRYILIYIWREREKRGNFRLPTVAKKVREYVHSIDSLFLFQDMGIFKQPPNGEYRSPVIVKIMTYEVVLESHVDAVEEFIDCSPHSLATSGLTKGEVWVELNIVREHDHLSFGRFIQRRTRRFDHRGIHHETSR